MRFKYEFRFNVAYLTIFLELINKYYANGVVMEFQRSISSENLHYISFNLNEKYRGSKMFDEFEREVRLIKIMEKI